MPRKGKREPRILKERRKIADRHRKDWSKNRLGRKIDDPRGRLIPRSAFEQPCCYGTSEKFTLLKNKIRGMLKIRKKDRLFIIPTGRDFLVEIADAGYGLEEEQNKSIWLLATNKEIIGALWHLVETGEIIEGPREAIV